MTHTWSCHICNKSKEINYPKPQDVTIICHSCIKFYNALGLIEVHKRGMNYKGKRIALLEGF